jgi:hypothetical protein
VLGMIVMSLSDVGVSTSVDPNYDLVVVVFNATGEEQRFTLSTLAGTALELHPVQAASNDPVVQTAAFDAGAGGFVVPARTTAAFVAPEGGASGLRLDSEDRIGVEGRLESEATPTQPGPTATVPEPAPTSPEPILSTPTLVPEPSDTGLPVWSWVVAVLAVIGGAAAWVWRRLRQRGQEM